MYFNSKIHILSTALFLVAAVNTFTEGFRGGIRMLLRNSLSAMPDMMNSVFQNLALITAIFRIIVSLLIFLWAQRRLKRYIRLVGKDDMEDMGRLQAEFLKDNKSTLTVEAIQQLVSVWAVILVGVEFVYDITSEGYTRFIEKLSEIINFEDAAASEMFVSIYNSTHGFKYIGMLIAILMGIIITGIFLRDVYLIIFSCISTIIFLAAFFMVQMNTVVIFNKAVGIVWTSVIFHAMQTMGILIFSLYIRHKYRGL